MSEYPRQCSSCEYFFSLLPKRKWGYCKAPIPHCVPMQHRITNKMKQTDGSECPAWQMAGRLECLYKTA